MGQIKIALFAFHVLLILIRSHVCGFKCNQSERKSLLKLKQSFLDTTNRFVSWTGEDCCKWEGVGCDKVTGDVVAIDLSCHKYGSNTGNLSASCTELEAFKVDSALLKLKYLKYLDLSGNNFNGIQIPHFMGSMKQLQYLNLSLAQFGGEVPSELGNLTNLRVLDLSSGDFPMEADKLEWAFAMLKLQYLDMSGINLSQAYDSMQVLHKLPSLLYLRLSNCQLGNAQLSHPLLNSTIHSSMLQHLDLSDNSLEGPPPQFLANLSFIRALDLSFNLLSSSIPYWFHSKRSLQVLNLAGNNLSGVEGSILGLLGELCGLKSLDLSFNKLKEDISGSKVNFSRGSKYHLENIYMNSNNISGPLSPWLGNFRRLRYLDLGSNSFSGGIPASLGRLASLHFLDLSQNYFSGTVPITLGCLSSLEWLDLSQNHLNGVVQELCFANLSSLNHLDLSSNPLSLELASDWHPPFQLQSLLVQSLKIHTPFPQWLQTQKKISLLDLSNAGIFGSLPNNIGDLFPSLHSLRLANNHISGTVPQSLCRLANLELLDLRKNQLIGLIPDCWNSSHVLEVIDLSSNKLSGSLPMSLSNVATLQSVSLSNNMLEGELQFTLSNWTSLLILDVGENTLSGKIPPLNGRNSPVLQVLRLRANKLKGKIPPQLCSLQKLQIIDLADNNLSGAIPECFGNFSAMASLQVSGIGAINVGPFPSEGSAAEVVKGSQQDYTTILGLLVNMDLSSNNLVGTIPRELTNLHSLLGLNLSHNHLSGAIPRQIGRMESLESLDLSNNLLSGTIPKSLSAITTLEHLNFSYNNLHGQIPTGNQLETLNDPSIYMGNLGLCGDPLPKKCKSDRYANGPASSVTDQGESKHETLWFYIVIILGFITGFWGVVAVLMVNKIWRLAYFKLAEDLAYWIFI